MKITKLRLLSCENKDDGTYKYTYLVEIHLGLRNIAQYMCILDSKQLDLGEKELANNMSKIDVEKFISSESQDPIQSMWSGSDFHETELGEVFANKFEERDQALFGNSKFWDKIPTKMNRQNASSNNEEISKDQSTNTSPKQTTTYKLKPYSWRRELNLSTKAAIIWLETLTDISREKINQYNGEAFRYYTGALLVAYTIANARMNNRSKDMLEAFWFLINEISPKWYPDYDSAVSIQRQWFGESKIYVKESNTIEAQFLSGIHTCILVQFSLSFTKN